MVEPKDAYEVLGVGPDADLAEIRRSYQKLARRFHPDLRPGDIEADREFQKVSEAYELLSDPDRRRRYDEALRKRETEVVAWRAERSTSTEVVQPPGGGRVTRTHETETVVHLRVSRGKQAPPISEAQPQRGEDLTVELPLEFAEVVRGTTKSFSVQREEECGACQGVGGDGASACEACGGRGAVVSLERIRVRIPPAVEEGGRMRVPGKGNRGFAGGPPGDLFLRLRVRPHPYFERRGLDTYGDLPVTVAEAVLGAELEVPTVDGPVRLTLPKGTPGGRRLRLAQRGLTSATGEVGDHYCRVRIIPPSWVDAETEGVLRRLRQPNPRENLPKEPL